MLEYSKLPSIQEKNNKNVKPCICNRLARCAIWENNMQNCLWSAKITSSSEYDLMSKKIRCAIFPKIAQLANLSHVNTRGLVEHRTRALMALG